MLTGPRSVNVLAQTEIFFNLWFNRLEVERFMYFYSFDLIYRSHQVIIICTCVLGMAKLHFAQKLTLMILLSWKLLPNLITFHL